MPEIILHLLLGIIGSNIGGLIMRNLNLGFFGNSLAGILGGVMCGQIVSTTLSIAPQFSPQISVIPQSLLGSIIGGIFGGLLLMSLLGIIKTSITQA